MDVDDAVVAVFPDHPGADAAVKKLTSAGFEMKHLSVVGGLSAIGAALTSFGVPKDSVLQYETAIKADGFLVMAHGTPSEMARAKSILASTNPASLADVYG